MKTMKIKRILRAVIVMASLLNINSCSSPTCENNKSEYQNGYDSGKLVKLMGGSGSCSSYVNSYNNETGRNTMKATDCFCEGYKDGLNGKPTKY
jgi:hypothetical protein